ncbi:MAG: hypothetical protein AMXMBFR53_32490 [Gemmatimonadota bacterium]
MSRHWLNAQHATDEEGPDLQVASLLRAVDPASADANYWLRFQSWVLKSAAPELARRRLMANVTMGDVLAGWARAVVPTAVAAAIVAGVLLLRPLQAGDDLASAASVEDLLVAGLEDETIPATLGDEDDATALAFAAERF